MFWLVNFLAKFFFLISNIFFVKPLTSEVWILLVVLCILPPFIMSIQEALMETYKKYSCYKFISRVFQGFASNFGGNFLSRGVAKSHQMTIFFYFINGIISFTSKIYNSFNAFILKVYQHLRRWLCRPHHFFIYFPNI